VPDQSLPVENCAAELRAITVALCDTKGMEIWRISPVASLADAKIRFMHDDCTSICFSLFPFLKGHVVRRNQGRCIGKKLGVRICHSFSDRRIYLVLYGVRSLSSLIQFVSVMEAAYLSATEEVLKHFNVTEENGLSDKQVEKSLAKHGKNGNSRF
jgi:hypothetical protein